MSKVAIKTCVCEHPYQDKKYGSQKRVMNKCEGKVGEVYRCTVCSRENGSKAE